MDHDPGPIVIKDGTDPGRIVMEVRVHLRWANGPIINKLKYGANPEHVLGRDQLRGPKWLVWGLE